MLLTFILQLIFYNNQLDFIEKNQIKINQLYMEKIILVQKEIMILKSFSLKNSTKGIFKQLLVKKY